MWYIICKSQIYLMISMYIALYEHNLLSLITGIMYEPNVTNGRA